MTGPAAWMSATEIAHACGVTVQAVPTWAKRYPNDFPAARDAGNPKWYPIGEVATWLDRRPIPSNRRRPDEDAGATYGPRFRRALGLPSAQTVDPGSAPSADAGSMPRPRAPAAPSTTDPWTELIEALGDSDKARQLDVDKAKQLDVVTALLWLRWSDPRGWLGAVAADRAKGVDALRRRWHARVGFEDAAPALPEVLAEPWWRGKLPAVAKALELCLRKWQERENSSGASMGTAFDAIMDRLAKDRHRGLGWYLTPAGVAQTMVRLVDPQPAETVLDPCCGYGELLVAAGEHVLAAGGSKADLALEGVAQDDRSSRIAAMNVAMHDLRAIIRPGSSDLLRSLPNKTREADVIVTNPPFDTAQWTDRDPKEQPKWRYGPPQQNRPSFAWLQLVIDALTDTGRAAVVMPAGATSPGNDRERAILRGMIEADVIRCIITLPKNLFRETATPTSIWILEHPGPAARRGVLLLDGATTVVRQAPKHRVLTAAGQDRIVAAWQAWSAGGGATVAEPGFAATPTASQIRDHNYALTPAGYLRKAPPALVLSPPATDQDDSTNLAALRWELASLHQQSDDLDEVLDNYLDRLARRATS